jgi:hypothetical protein
MRESASEGALKAVLSAFENWGLSALKTGD